MTAIANSDVKPNWSINPTDSVGKIFDDALECVTKKLDELIERTENASKDVVIVAGEQAAKVIASAKAACLESLEKTYQDTDKVSQENLDRIADFVNKIITEEKEDLLNTSEQIENIIKSFDLRNGWFPLLSETQPRFVAVELDPEQKETPIMSKVLVTFKGNFPYAGSWGSTPPTFTLNEKEYAPISCTPQVLKFELEVSSAEPKLNLQKCCYINGSLKVHWKASVLSAWTHSEYKCLVGILPTTAGKIKAVYEKAEVILEKNCESNPIVVGCSKKWKADGGLLTPTKDYKVVPDSGVIHWKGEKKGTELNVNINSYTNEGLNYSYSTRHGSGTFTIAFKATKLEPAKERVEEINAPHWGSVIELKPKEGEKLTKIVLDAFNGDHVEWQPGTELTNPFISMESLEGKFQVKVKKSNDIQAW